MRRFVARISKSFLSEHPCSDSRMVQSYCNRIPIPVVKYPRGVPGVDETCAVLISTESRWYYHLRHAAEELRDREGKGPEEIRELGVPGKPFGERTVIRIYRLDPPAEKPAHFELAAFRSKGKATRMKSVPSEEPPPDCEEIAGGTNSNNGTHWCRIAVLLRTIPAPDEEFVREEDERLFSETT
jgi:hypothetical protein